MFDIYTQHLKDCSFRSVRSFQSLINSSGKCSFGVHLNINKTNNYWDLQRSYKFGGHILIVFKVSNVSSINYNFHVKPHPLPPIQIPPHCKILAILLPDEINSTGVSIVSSDGNKRLFFVSNISTDHSLL